MNLQARNKAKLLTKTEIIVKIVDKRRVQIITQRRPRTSPRYPHAYDDTIMPRGNLNLTLNPEKKNSLTKKDHRC